MLNVHVSHLPFVLSEITRVSSLLFTSHESYMNVVEYVIHRGINQANIFFGRRFPAGRTDLTSFSRQVVHSHRSCDLHIPCALHSRDTTWSMYTFPIRDSRHTTSIVLLVVTLVSHTTRRLEHESRSILMKNRSV